MATRLRAILRLHKRPSPYGRGGELCSVMVLEQYRLSGKITKSNFDLAWGRRVGNGVAVLGVARRAKNGFTQWRSLPTT